MKKTFKLTHPKIKYARLIDATKHEVKKYLRRERNKQLPEGADFLDFDCKYGVSESDAQVIQLSAINKHIDEAASQNLTAFYLEILAKPGYREVKEK
jgi:hypothetical protein